MKKFVVECKKCGSIINRDRSINNAVCFDCQKLRKEEAANKHYATLHPSKKTRRIKSQEVVAGVGDENWEVGRGGIVMP